MRSPILTFDGAKLKAAREVAGLTQRQLAAKVGVDRSAVARWESTKLADEPSGINFRRLCKILKVKMDGLLLDAEQAA